MKKGIKIEECYLTCPDCKKEYDISKLTREACKKRQKNLYCPGCGRRIGTIQ